MPISKIVMSMNKRFYSIVVMLLLHIALSPLRGQSTALPFFVGFEGVNNKRCELNAGQLGSALTNKWCISDHEPYMGDSCLVISSDGGVTASYDEKRLNTSVAYIDFLLPPATYDLSFAWRCVGERDKDGLYVCWAPITTTINSSLGGLPDLVVQNALSVGVNGGFMLYGERAWQIVETTVHIPGSGTTSVPYRLYFVWDNDVAGSSDVAACIDNVQLTATTCGHPSNIRFTRDATSVTLTWDGPLAASYEVLYTKFGSPVADTIPNVSGSALGNSVTITDIEEGLYDFFVRSICPSADTSMWVVLRNQLVYLSSLHCIDYIDLTGSGTTCTTGSYKKPYAIPGAPVDSGPGDWIRSRHTVHFMPDETDPFTGGKLHTVGPNSVASIRIGNSEGSEAMDNYGAESVSYTYTIGSNEQIIMLVDYAIAYESPGHPKNEQPSVNIDILDENDVLIDPDGLRCNEVYFYPPAQDDASQSSDDTWQCYPRTQSSYGKEDVLWRDWSTIGINLSSLAGRTIKVRLTVRDCALSAHFSHAFFSIRCVEAALEGYTCGDDLDSFRVSAPPGFDYVWYRPAAPDDTLSRERTFSVKSENADTFYCNVHFKGNPKCYFSLPAYLVPRMPLAAFKPEHRPHDCRNRLVLRNTGGVMSDGVLTSEPCEYIEWTITDLSTGDAIVITDALSPELYFDNRGDTIAVRLLSGISGNLCTDVHEDTIIVPAIGESVDSLHIQVCSFPFFFGGQPYDAAGRYSNHDDNDPSNDHSYAGCDSTFYLILSHIEAKDSVVCDTICQGETYSFFEHEFVEPTPAGGFLKTLKTSDGKCDSLRYTLHLYVRPRIDLRFDSLPEICVGDPHFDVPYRLLQGDVSSYSLHFTNKAIDAGFQDIGTAEVTDSHIRIPLPSDTLRPDNYLVNVVCETDSCGIFTFDLPFTVHYPTEGIMEQKWNDAIALLNSNHNYGNFEYTAYRWYRNGQIIPGATSSYLYIGSRGEGFDSIDEYSVELTRVGESYSIMSCPFTPVRRTDVSEYITIVQPQGAQTLSLTPAPVEQGIARWYTTSGIFCGEYLVVPADASIPLPGTPGIYLLHMTFPTSTNTFKVVIR